MKRTILPLALGLLFTAVAIQGAEEGNRLAQVLGLIPAALQPVTLAFTDWIAVKVAIGVPWLTSESSLDERIAFALRTDVDHALGSAYGLPKLSVHAETWGFDSTDLEWEAQILAPAMPPTYVLKLRSDFNLDVLIGRFDERAFTQTASCGAALFSRGVDPGQEWIAASEFAIHNTAVLEEEKLLILSSSYPAVKLLLATRAGQLPSLASEASAVEAIAHLAEPFAAYILIGASTCLRFSPNPLLSLIGSSVDRFALDRLRAWLSSGEPLFGYEALGVGYRHEEGRPVGTITFVYADAGDALHDLEPRRLLAETGGSAHQERPISEAYFTLEDARLDGNAILFTVRPVSDQPRRLFRMLLYADAAFGACR